MNGLALITASLFTLYIGLVLPLLGKKRYQKFLKEVTINPDVRSRYYLRILLNQWSMVIVVGIIMLLGSVSPSMLGLQTPATWEFTFLLIIEVVVLLLVVQIVLQRYTSKKRRARLIRRLLAIKQLLPHTPRERILWLLVSITAGICEEIIFRGFLPWYFFQAGAFIGLQITFLVTMIFSTILFGFVHLYQGWRGMLGVTLLGAFFAYCYAFTGSLILSIIMHILLDARLVFLAPVLLKWEKQDEDIQVPLAPSD